MLATPGAVVKRSIAVLILLALSALPAAAQCGGGGCAVDDRPPVKVARLGEGDKTHLKYALLCGAFLLAGMIGTSLVRESAAMGARRRRRAWHI
jgi:hypothetical protein